MLQRRVQFRPNLGREVSIETKASTGSSQRITGQAQMTAA